MLLLVGNPTAQSGKNAARIAKARQLFEDQGLAHEFIPTEPAGATVAAVARALSATKFDTAVYMGGDGTFAEVAKGIFAADRATDVRLGMLPTGTANDQGKSFGLAADEGALARNVEVIAAGRERKLDVGRLRALTATGTVVKEELFFDSAGWGLSPRVLKLRNEDRAFIAKVPVLRELWRDHLVYAGALARTFLASYVDDDKFDATIEADGQRLEWTGLTDLVVKGTRIYGGAWVFDATAEPDDGLFEIIPFRGKRDWVSKAIVHLDESGAVSESLASVGVTHSENARAARITLSFATRDATAPLFAQIDGEEFPPSARAEIEVLPRALRLIVPAEHAK